MRESNGDTSDKVSDWDDCEERKVAFGGDVDRFLSFSRSFVFGVAAVLEENDEKGRHSQEKVKSIAKLQPCPKHKNIVIVLIQNINA